MKTLPVRLMAALLILTVGLSCLPAEAQDPASRQTLESDDPHVLQGGTWSSQATSSASNGSYLFSSGAEDDILGLTFVGKAVEVIYVAGPSLGTLAIEIDDTVVRTVITTTDQIAYSQSARVDYLSNEPHALKVYAQAGGVIAIDAFVITPHSATALAENDDSGSAQSSTCAPINATHRVSLRNPGQEVFLSSYYPSLSGEGRLVAFESDANLAGGDTNAYADIYVYDRQTCTATRVSVDNAGTGGNTASRAPAISADGRYVAFYSLSTNLVTGDSNFQDDVFVHDRQTNTTTRVSVATGGAQGFGHPSQDPALSADGRFVAFSSWADGLVMNDNGSYDIFVHDRQTATTTLISVDSNGVPSTAASFHPDISADGRFVVYDSIATNLVTGDTNGQSDIFLRDRQTGTTTRISVATGGAQANNASTYPDISANGRYITYESLATNLVTGDSNGQPDIFLYDRQTATTTLISQSTAGVPGNNASARPRLSSDGRYVVFHSNASNLSANDDGLYQDVFVRDRQTNTTSRLSTNMGGISSENLSGDPAISDDGHYVAFAGLGRDLVLGDTNDSTDIFVTSVLQPSPDTLALFQPSYQGVVLVDTLVDSPAPSHFTFYSAYAPVAGGQWIMGDWDGDGQKTPGVYRDRALHYTNDVGETKTWSTQWIGLNGPIVAGRVDGNYDCFGVIDSANFPPYGIAFVLYITCDLTGSPSPPLLIQWLSVLLPDSAGFAGTFQFVMGDWNGDGQDTIACRRGAFITWTNDSALNASAGFPNAQYLSPPSPFDEGLLVGGDWDGNNTDSFGLFYQNGELYYRNDLDFNSGVYLNQSVGTPLGNTGVQAATWH